jgi:hypothetical protein
MRPCNSSYDAATAEFRSENLGERTYALISNHNGPCSVVAPFASLDEAIAAARNMDTDAATTDLDDEIEYDSHNDCDDTDIIGAAQNSGWVIVASAQAGEYWTVMTERGDGGRADA